MPAASRDASSPVPVPSVPPGDGPDVRVNDVHSGLSPTRVRRVEAVASVAEVVRFVGEADRWPIGVSGGRNSMGGQPFASDAVLLDTRGLDRVLELDSRNGTV